LLLALSGCLLFGQVFFAACSNTPKDLRGAMKKAIDGTDEQIFVEDSVERYYHPNVMMKRGEAFFEKEEYSEALVEYNRFLELYRTHVLAPYAAFRIGEVHFKMAKTIDRDPEPVQKAIAALDRVRKEYPGSRYDTQAQEKLKECHNWLAEMHLFVGRFYYRRGSYLAAAHRFEHIIKTYPDRPVAPDALYFLAMSYHEMGADDWARESLVQLAEKYPDSKAAGGGKSLFAKLGGAKPGPLLAQKSNPAPISDVGSTAAGQRLPDLLSLSQLNQLGAPSAATLDQTFTACRLGAWC
jgi:outer membrane protein assembly factor BamD